MSDEDPPGQRGGVTVYIRDESLTQPRRTAAPLTVPSTRLSLAELFVKRLTRDESLRSPSLRGDGASLRARLHRMQRALVRGQLVVLVDDRRVADTQDMLFVREGSQIVFLMLSE
ncbi:hypothetical protein [Tropicibacter sp. S64]|uniref:hypothetical protein n=1 Tax=Tropicibacter sp. S64 TaxID=3415122 RepID=UPI003C7E8226